MVTAELPGPSGDWVIWVAKEAAPAFDALSLIMRRHGYLFRESDGGAFNCRHIGDDPNQPWSLHAYGVAVDINPSKNQFGQCGTDMPAAFVADVLELRTNSGARVFSWGGSWRPCSTADPMHFQIDCRPSDVNTGIQNGDDDDMTPDEVRQIIREELDRTSKGEIATKYSFWGIKEALFAGKIGNSGRSAAQFWEGTQGDTNDIQNRLTRIEKKIDELA